MSTTYKAQAIAYELADRLKVRAGLVAAELDVVVSFDTDKNPLIQIGTLASTDEGALLKVVPADWPLAEDILGNTAFQFTPHAIHVLWEAAPLGGLTSIEKAEILAQVSAMGCEVRLYESSSGAGVVLADIDDSAKFKGSIPPDARYPLISQQ